VHRRKIHVSKSSYGHICEKLLMSRRTGAPTRLIHRGLHELLSSICTHCHNLFSVICGYIFTSLTFLCSAFNWLQCFCMSVGKSNVIHQMIYILFTNPISQYNSNLKWILYTPLFPSERKVEIYIKKMTKLIENKQHTNGNCMVIHKNVSLVNMNILYPELSFLLQYTTSIAE
jgi:hypothetical protein